MALTIKKLIEKNKSAFNQQFYIESVYLSQTLILKALKQVFSEEKINVDIPRVKLTECVKILKHQYDSKPQFKTKLKKAVYKNICEFAYEYKTISKELKFQYPEFKLKQTSLRGIEIVSALNTVLIKLKSNKPKI